MFIKRLKASKLVYGDGLSVDSRIVILEILRGKRTEYSVHWEVLPKNSAHYFICGDYMRDLEDIKDIFYNKLENEGVKENKEFVQDADFTEI